MEDINTAAQKMLYVNMREATGCASSSDKNTFWALLHSEGN